ncbi:unnamed protein product [Ilex paraguariensis]|uniref:Uncharacterized protein n=1 Tax=Ilex paraguariensis TaxID=185542 RepID=A0ABC8RR55_9AQUA
MQVKSSVLQGANDDDVGAVEVMKLKSSELQGANDDDVGAVEGANDDDVGAVEVMQLKSSELQGANDDDVGAVEWNLHSRLCKLKAQQLRDAEVRLFVGAFQSTALHKNLYRFVGVRPASNYFRKQEAANQLLPKSNDTLTFSVENILDNEGCIGYKAGSWWPEARRLQTAHGLALPLKAMCI